MFIRESRVVWNALNSVICIYKPAEVTCKKVRDTLVSNICKDLCEMKCRDPVKYVSIEGTTNKELTVQVKDSYADHPLVVGPRYQMQDVRCTWSMYLGRQTSGVMIYGINEGTKLAQKIHLTKPTRAYRLVGKFGEATDNFFKDGKIVEKSTYAHIKLNSIDRLLSSMQANHQKKMFELCGVDIQSQAAYELAIKGPIRPANSKIPVIYGIKCIHFESPNFTIEIQCVNEYEMYLKTLIHEIGMQLRSTAHCTAIQCIRHSYFSTEHALLKKHWTLQNIMSNMTQCTRTIYQHENLTRNQRAALQQT